MYRAEARHSDDDGKHSLSSGVLYSQLIPPAVGGSTVTESSNSPSTRRSPRTNRALDRKTPSLPESADASSGRARRSGPPTLPLGRQLDTGEGRWLGARRGSSRSG